MKNKIIELFQLKHWQLIANTHSVDKVVRALSFKDAMRLACRLLYNRAWDYELQEYAVSLLEAIREFFSEEWNSDWRCDAFLGLACNITFKFDQRYLAYKRAFEKAPSPLPPGLLIEFARCCDCPGDKPISYDEAIALIQEAIKGQQYVDGVGLLQLINALKGDEKSEKYWRAKLMELGDKGIRSPRTEPEFLIEVEREIAKEREI